MTKKTKNKKMSRKHKKFLRVLVYIVLVAFVLSLIFFIGFGIYHLCTSSKYTFKKVQFKNNNVYVYEELLDAAKLPIGENLYSLSKSKIDENLKELPYIESVKIKRKRPDTLIITVNEYVSKYVAYNKDIDKYLRLTASGVILDYVTPESKSEEELLVYGINFDDKIKTKTKIVELEIEKLQFYDKVYEIYNKSKIDKKITSIEFKDGNIILTLDYDLSVILDNNNLDYKINFLKSILEKIKGKAGTIDMTKENPVFTESV